MVLIVRMIRYRDGRMALLGRRARTVFHILLKILNETPWLIFGGAVRGVGNGVAAPAHTTGTSRELTVKPLPTPRNPCIQVLRGAEQ